MTRVLIVSVVKTLAVTMKFVYLIANVRPVAQAHVINCGSLDRTYVSVSTMICFAQKLQSHHHSENRH